MSRARSRAADPLEVFADEFAQDAPADEFACPDADDGPVRFAEPPSDTIAPVARKGRGAVSNRVGRFEPYARERVDDGWTPPPGQAGSRNPDPLEPGEPKLRTTVAIDASRTVIARNQSPDVPFDRSINPYRGCEHGCIYCFARPTHAFLGLSPGLDFETRLLAKPDAPALLRKELARPGYECAPIAMGTNTDPYQPVEREMKITRGILEVLAEHDHPVTIVTKSDLVVRDLDILGPMAARGLAKVGVSVTTLDRELARKLEPRAARPDKRLAAIRACTAAGVPAAVMVAPVIPAVNDHEIEPILEAAAAAGADSAAWILLRLPLEIADLIEEFLRSHFPDRADRVLSLVRQTRGGRLYRAEWGRRMRGDGPYAQMIAQRFRTACGRLGLAGRTGGLDTSRFRAPTPPRTQLSLFGD
ncbi:radical SAM protein [Thalassobaculum fulvum]|uniref:Radical SAM protein n=1 Tax=Thalassobaculum fulvum TaxID=1633335 RepID=A0A919CML9_9PROT|nr:PA0069 family radical SAM protein [Thalassobaculum fulvum]GHD39513.1 radical SAM protein [Thalassobaculum fulvum]